MSTQTWSEGEQQEEDPARSAVDIAEHVAALFRPESAPLLTLGVFERVGSNWVSDTLRPYLPQHNEPFRQQLGARHPLSPNNSRPPGPADTDLPGLPAHHLACALADLYGTDRRHMVKETNLWLATGAITNLLPNSPLLVLSRAPLGIASSFARGNLFERWHYASRYAMLGDAARRSAHWAAWSALLPEDDPEPAVALARLIAFNTLLLAQAVRKDVGGIGRPCAHLAYERHVLAPESVRATLATYLDIPLPAQAQAGTATAGARGADTTFATGQHKSELVAEVDARTAALVPHHVAETLARAGNVVEHQVVEITRHWLSGDDLYEVRDPAPSVPRPRAGTAQREERRPGPASYRPAVEGSTVAWRTHLISNAEVAELLNILSEAGMDNTRDGVNLLIVPMRVQRGGRLHQDQSSGRWRPTPGYEHHPAYWVTWLGAAALAAWHGARLPNRAEVLQAAALAPTVYNADYRFGDATTVIEPGRDPGDIHHLVGNVQVWCQDGPEASGLEFPLRRYLVGAAWNTPATREAVVEERSRYLLGASRGVGVRLVRDPSIRAADEIGAWELAERIGAWVNSLDPTGVPVGYLDQALVTALTGPCAESGEAEAGQD
ncbi:SUMF1/EgtB/PvdO family nonheme iron enzyme [Kitasatospora sp. NPDC004669]|uniref:SUMF1/EgtB/PvdO family nonheme iron enzyme n=1 Tax=Kitasatospora sp. NPDC004669 TaxID=3154555 RepID=UPI0033A3EFE6